MIDISVFGTLKPKRISTTEAEPIIIINKNTHVYDMGIFYPMICNVGQEHCISWDSNPKDNINLILRVDMILYTWENFKIR